MLNTASFLPSKIPNADIAILTLIILYIVGVCGITTNFYLDFILLTPLNLLFSLGVVLTFHQNWDRSIIQFLLMAYLVGLGAELYGVQTGRLFGSYEYGPVLGPKIWGTPLLIGVNWMLLSYSTGVTMNHLFPKWHWLPKGFMAAIGMVGLDLLIEPVAIRYNFWSWTHPAPPLQNYIGWFLVSLPLLCIFTKTQSAVRNKVAIALFILQFLFFAILNIL